MNVAASSIAPVQPPAPPSPPSVQIASHDDAHGSFANAMQSQQQASVTQPKDASPKSTPPAPQLHQDHPVAVDQALASPASCSRAVSPLKQAASNAQPQAALPGDSPDADPGGSDPSLTSSLTKTTSPAQVPTPLSGPYTSAAEAAASQPGSGPVQPGTPVVAAVDAGVPAIKDAIVNKFDWKAAAAGDGKSAKKTLHVHETAVETTGWTSQTHNKPSVSTPVEAAVAAPSQCLATPVDQQDATDQTTVLEATSSTAAPRSAVAAAKGFAPASQKADVAPDPVILPGDATPQGAQPASPLASTANQRTLGKTADTPDPSDADEGTLSSGNAFSIPALTQAVAAQPAAVFAPSLPIQFAPAGQHHVSADLATSPVSSAGGNSIDGASPQPVPVKRLEIALHDPFLGNVDVRAEMRGGALHAIVTGSQDGATPSMAALHQFLQQHDVTVHSLNYATVREGVTATASTTFSNSDMSRDTAGGSFSGGRDGGSHNAQGEGSQQQQRFGSSSAGYDESPVAPPYASQPLGIAAARPTLNTGSTLSIHI